MVGDGHAVGVTTEITEDMSGSAEGRLGIDVPVLVAQCRDPLFEAGLITEMGGGPRQSSRFLR